MALLVSDAFDLGILDRRLAKSLDNRFKDFKCDCGSDLEISLNLNSVWCSGVACRYKIANRLTAMAHLLGIERWNDKMSQVIVLNSKLKSPYQIFIAKCNYDCTEIEDFRLILEELKGLKGTELELWEIVRNAGIALLNKCEYSLFRNYKDINLFYDDLDKYGLPFIAEKLGYVGESIIACADIHRALIEYKDELEFGCNLFSIK